MSLINNSIDVPADIKTVNFLTNILLGLFILLFVISGVQYILKNNVKNLEAIVIRGVAKHSDTSSIRKLLIENIRGNFYSMDLFNTKKIFESAPWVSHAVVKRVYPGLIEVKLSEYKPKAIWGLREDMRLVDESGTIFEINTDEDEYDSLPQLIGFEGQGKLMLDMYENISNALSPLNSNLKNLELNARGSWVVTLEGGAHIELGRGSTQDVIQRAIKFAMNAEKMLTKLNKKIIDLQYVDLRHSEGYALRMHGVSTLDLTIPTTSLKK